MGLSFYIVLCVQWKYPERDGFFGNTSNADTGADIISDGLVLLFEVDLASTVSLAGLTLSGGDRCSESYHRIVRRSDRLQLLLT